MKVHNSIGTHQAEALEMGEVIVATGLAVKEFMDETGEDWETYRVRGFGKPNHRAQLEDDDEYLVHASSGFLYLSHYIDDGQAQEFECALHGGEQNFPAELIVGALRETDEDHIGEAWDQP